MSNFNDNKAGLNGLDKDRIQRVIASHTSSNFGSHHAKRQRRIDERCSRMSEFLAKCTPAQMQRFEQEADTVLAVLETQRDLSRVIVHIDMDAFFASVEMRDDPALRIVPMAVGGDSMLSTSNYIARRFGIRSGMPGFIARKLCTDLVIVRGNYDKYRRVSAVVRRVFLRYDNNVHMGSLDEACLDITDLITQRLNPVSLPRVRYDGRNDHCVCRLPLLSNTEYEQLGVDLSSLQWPSLKDGDVNDNTDRCRLSKDSSSLNEQTKVENLQTTSNCDTTFYVNTNEKSASATSSHNLNSRILSSPFSEHSEGSVKQSPLPEWKECTCDKCGKTRRAIVDTVEFGTTVDEIVNEIRFQVEQETGLTCSAGIGANWLLAKVCSDMRKPNGQFRVANERNAIVDFMKSLPVRKVPGVGNVTESLLRGVAEVEKCADLIEKRTILRATFSDLQFQFFMSIALGVHGSGGEAEEERNHEDTSDRRSISTERTFTPQNVPAMLFAECERLCEMLIADCASHGVTGGRTATVKIKYASFDVVTRARSSTRLINTLETLRPIVFDLLRNELSSRQWPKVRLLGVRLSRLEFVNGKTNDDSPTRDVKSNKQKTLADLFRSERNPTKSSNENVEVIDLSEDEKDVTSEDTSCLISEKRESFALTNDIKVISKEKDNDDGEVTTLTVSSGKPRLYEYSEPNVSDDEICIVSSNIVNPPQCILNQPPKAKKKKRDATTKKRTKPAVTCSSKTKTTEDIRPKLRKQSPEGSHPNTLNRYFPMML